MYPNGLVAKRVPVRRRELSGLLDPIRGFLGAAQARDADSTGTELGQHRVEPTRLGATKRERQRG